MKGYSIGVRAPLARATLFILACLACLSGCNDAGQRGCLGGGAICNPSSTLQVAATVEANSSTASTTSSGFTCTAVPSPASVYPYHWLQVTINVTGGAAGNKTITNFDNYTIPSFSNSATIVGEYFADKAGTVVHRTIELQDSAGATTSCDFSVTVLNPTGGGNTTPSTPSCSIAIQESSIKAGDTAHLTFTATNASSVTFSNLYGSSSWKLDDSVIHQTGPLSATAGLTYSFAGQKTVSVQVNNQGVQNTCSTSFFVGATGLAITQTPPGATALRGEFNLTVQATGITNPNAMTFSFTTTDAHATIVKTGWNTARVTTDATTDRSVPVLVTANGNGVTLTQNVALQFKTNPPSVAYTGCSAYVSPLYASSQTSADVGINSPARVVVMPQGGVGPFTAGIASVTLNGSSFGYALDAPSPDSQTVPFHFTQVGTPLVTVYLKDGFSNQYQFCSTYAVSQ